MIGVHDTSLKELKIMASITASFYLMDCPVTECPEKLPSINHLYVHLQASHGYKESQAGKIAKDFEMVESPSSSP